jgi:vanillate O-demethylase monooxygenase subunit
MENTMPYPKNAWYVAGWERNLNEGEPIAMSILDEPLVIYRAQGTGRLVVLEDRCVHRFAPLSLGKCEGERIRCGYHGLLFDSDGKLLGIPGQDLIPSQANVRCYPAVFKHSWIWVWMGNPALADEALIPPATGYDNPDWVLGHGDLDYQASGELANDNLLDFSHVPYIHAESFALGDSYANERPKVTAVERGIRVERWTLNIMGTATAPRPEDNLVDHWVSYDFLVPGIMLLWSGMYPAGTAQSLNFEKPDYSQAVGVSIDSHMVTPMTSRTARYYYIGGPLRGQGDEAVRDLRLRIQAKAFAEDKRIIEAQQRVIDRMPGKQMMPTAHDLAVTMYNRVVERLIRESGTAERVA